VRHAFTRLSETEKKGQMSKDITDQLGSTIGNCYRDFFAVLTGCLPISCLFYPFKTEFIIFGLSQQLSKHNNPTIHLPNNAILLPVDSARIPGVIFGKNFSFAQHISVVSKSCIHNIHDTRRRYS